MTFLCSFFFFFFFQAEDGIRDKLVTGVQTCALPIYGLAADVQHLSAASEVGIEINLERIPCWEGVEAMAAIASGEEFELLLTMPPSFSDASASSFRAETGVHLTRIGRCLRGSGGRRVVVRLLAT